MSSAGGPGAGSPLIAGALTSTSEFHDFSDDDIGGSNLLDFSNSPDTLQSLDAISTSKDHDTFLNPQQLALGPFPDSPNGSSQDSSSESAGPSKRLAVSASAKTPATSAGDASMDDDASNMNMDWGNTGLPHFDEDDNAFNFGATTAQPAINGFYGFSEQDDSFMDQSFDFESASSSPDAPSTGPVTMASPGMPTIESTSPHKSSNLPAKPKHQPHKKKASTYSVSSSQNGIKRSHSREVSPMSTLVASHNSSPATTFINSPPAMLNPEFYHMMGQAGMWPNKADIQAAATPDCVPSPASFAPNNMAQARHMTQHMSMFTPAPFNNTGPVLRILPTPLKSRVETQIPIKMTLSPLPPGVTKLHLPAHTISKPKLLAKPTPAPSPDTLVLHVSLVCTSAMEKAEWKKNALERARTQPQGSLPDLDDEENSPQNGGEVRICAGCITRERKRAARKKIKKPDEEKVWSQDEERRVIVFNTQEVKEWQPMSGMLDSNGRPEHVVSNRTMQIDAPMRIACYCRHHGEKMGFNVIFTIKDYQDRLIAQAMSNPIMITDDHKTHPMAQLTSQPPMSDTVVSSSIPLVSAPAPEVNGMMAPIPNSNFRMSQAGSDVSSMQNGYTSSNSGKTTPTMSTAVVTPRPHSRPSSPTQGHPVPKRRKGSNSRVPNGLEMTRLDTSPQPAQSITSQRSSVASPFSPSAFHQAEHLFGLPNGQLPFANGPPTPNSNNEQASFFANNRSASMDNLAMANMYSAPTSSHASRAPSPNGLRAGAPQNQFAALASSLFPPVGAPRATPTIHKIIPNEGPKIGGIEVTVLGAAFFQGLEVWFGDQRATTTTFWGESSLVCLLPPSPVSGTVPVTFKLQGVSPQNFPMAKQPPTFKYVDDNEDKLIRTALSVLGQKMSGQMVDVSDLARRILNVNDGSGSSGGWTSGPSANGPQFNHASHEHLESQLLKVLDLIDLDDSAHRTKLDLRRSTGHTMLHLACSLGYHRFVAALLARGANPDARDKGGFTALHMASIQSHSEIARRLIIGGADPTIRSLSGLTAADVAQSRAVVRAIRHSERHARSRSSGGSIHSRTNSSASVRSLWEPLTRANTHDGPISIASGEESPEYTSGDFEDEDPDENSYLSMRRASEIAADKDHSEETVDEVVDTSAPTAMAAALKEQFQQQLQQLQQTMAVHLQSLAHIPQLPQMPGMPVLPDYQGYFQRMQQYVPGMSGTRPGSAGENSPKVDGRWWDLSSYMGGPAAAPAPPPAYEDIFPPKVLEEKQRAAAEAACEADADMKCSALYDQPQTKLKKRSTRTKPAMASVVSDSSDTEIPSVLKIGRKNAITQEQQDQFLRAREQKLKRLSNDRKLFFVWIPLLLIMICAMLYSYFPKLFPFLFESATAVIQVGHARATRYLQNRQERVVPA
ncbi:ankyrin repeat protein [Cordyceps fumosorosea ARSEF 2679]|uniref:Ankyrin repeat protein n=1 Tax=Cordyceps fumosorosea (strain ARSEF 2679) TaxID=1081104 RepID=A0A168BS26_CORFA|nr:ankyrin repeat protein [Cordyceps fumosorosea ARSEF 2679]OAA70476.1 ankyrin repeat protein [Cordyceps fumosorosea ARSEF 2679]